LTTGESPIVTDSSGAGAVNRVIDIECRDGEYVIAEGTGTDRARELKSNYGFAGEMYVKSLTEKVIEEAQNAYDRYLKQLSQGDTTEKQAAAAAMILVGDELADRFIFKTSNHLSAQQISEFLKTKASVSAGQRGYNYICDWVTMNANCFDKNNETGKFYGIVEDGTAYIIYSAFNKALKDEGYDTKAILSWLKANKLIETSGSGNTKTKRLRPDMQPKCVWLKLPDNDEELPDLDGFEGLV
jgi:hypothetical protein